MYFMLHPMNPFSRMCTPTKGCVIFIVAPWKEYTKKSHTVHEDQYIFHSIVYWSNYTYRGENIQGLKDESSSKQVKVWFGKT